MTARERSHLEDLTIPADGLTDNELVAVSLVCAKLELGAISSLGPAAREFFAEVGRQALALKCWRASYLDHLDRLLQESGTEP